MFPRDDLPSSPGVAACLWARTVRESHINALLPLTIRLYSTKLELMITLYLRLKCNTSHRDKRAITFCVKLNVMISYAAVNR